MVVLQNLGLSGFTYWSHDVGGFVDRAPRDLYRRWMAWGVLTSHTRAHGAPPREPWEYDEALMEDFRRALGLKYSLMPYIIAQAKDSSAHGYPMLRTRLASVAIRVPGLASTVAGIAHRHPQWFVAQNVHYARKDMLSREECVEHGLFVAPGSSFGPYPSHVRVCFTAAPPAVGALGRRSIVAHR